MSWNARRAVLADTGPLYAAADPSDQYHPRAQAEVRRLTDQGFGVVVARPTLLEAYSLVLHRLGPRRGLAWLDDVLPGVFVVEPSPEDYAEALRRLRGIPDQPLTLVDAVLAVLSDRLGLPVWIFDHHFDVMRVSVWR